MIDSSAQFSELRVYKMSFDMRALQVFSHGEEPVLTNLPAPGPGPGQVQVKIHACGLNFADLLMIGGTYQDTPDLPFVPGMEVSGVVTAVGETVTGCAPGDRVAVFSGCGGLAEIGVFDVARVIRIPDSMSFEQAAGFLIAYGTSHIALTHRAGLKPGETLLVTGAAGGVGLTAVEIGAHLGATVVALARGEDKLAVAQKAGAHHLIDASQDLRARLLDLGGADVVYDAVGGDVFNAAFRACNPEARLLSIGFASGKVPKIPANHLMVKNLSVIGFYFGGYMAFRPDVIASSLKTLMDWFDKGTLCPHISHVLPLDRAADGLELLRTRASTGKVVITM